MARLLIKDGFVLPGDGAAPTPADVLIEGATVLRVAPDMFEPSATVLDAEGRYVVPGFVDAHSHVDAMVFDEQVQLALLRQGITSVIVGQDGVSCAPGDGSFAREYFAPINGVHRTYRGPRVSDLLRTYDDGIPIGIAYLVPAGTVRHLVMGSEKGQADEAALAEMTQLVSEGIEDGAVGLSTGLDYVPGQYANAAELAALCAPLTARGLPYVSHMRGGYEHNAQVGVDEAMAIGAAAKIPVHISHFHTPASEAWRLMARMEEHGVAGSFDAYPYTRGSSMLAMTMLPPELNALTANDVIGFLADPDRRLRVREEWFPRVAKNPSLGDEWPDLITVAHTSAPEHAFAPGLKLSEVATRLAVDPIEAAFRLLEAARLDVNVVMAVHDQRPVEDLGRLLAHPRHMGGSDGIFVGSHPHPRARGTFGAYLATYVRERGYLSWADAVQHLSTAAVDLFALGDRGRIKQGAVADIALIDPDGVADRATYQEPMRLAEGIDDVLIGGVAVLQDGQLTGAAPGGAIRAAPRKSS